MRASTKGARRRAGRPSTSRPPIRRYHYVTDDPAALASRSGTVTVSTNSSVGPLQLELLPPKNAGFGRNWQLPMSSACLRHFGTRHRWMGAPGARGGGAFRDHAGGWVCGLRGWLVAALPLHELQQLATSTATLPGVSLPIPGCVPTKGASTATNAYWRASPGAAARPPPPPPGLAANQLPQSLPTPRNRVHRQRRIRAAAAGRALPAGPARPLQLPRRGGTALAPVFQRPTCCAAQRRGAGELHVVLPSGAPPALLGEDVSAAGARGGAAGDSWGAPLGGGRGAGRCCHQGLVGEP